MPFLLSFVLTFVITLALASCIIIGIFRVIRWTLDKIHQNEACANHQKEITELSQSVNESLRDNKSPQPVVYTHSGGDYFTCRIRYWEKILKEQEQLLEEDKQNWEKLPEEDKQKILKEELGL